MLSKRPGLTLLLAGLVLFLLVRPLVDGLWIIGGLLASLAFGAGILAIAGGGYLLARGRTGIGRGS